MITKAYVTYQVAVKACCGSNRFHPFHNYMLYTWLAEAHMEKEIRSEIEQLMTTP